MIEKLQTVSEKYKELGEKLLEPSILADNKEYIKLAREYKNLEPLVALYNNFYNYEKSLEEAKSMLATETQEEMKEYLKEEIENLSSLISKCEEDAKIMLLPKDENDTKNVIMEIRPGTGGEESALFAYEIMRMYLKYAEKLRWKVDIIDLSETEIGGVKEATLLIKGNNAYGKLKFESGVHRVQRVPDTETQGRVHTSAITVAVLPEVEDVDIEILDKDIRIDTYRSSGAGGQHINKTDSAIRITHFPTGIVVACQDERSQIKNREKAFAVLRSKIYDYYKSQQDKDYAENRKNQVGSGDRSERIRTYNYPQGRCTDHRINLTLYSLESVLEGELDQLIEPLLLADQRRKIEESLSS